MVFNKRRRSWRTNSIAATDDIKNTSWERLCREKCTYGNTATIFRSWRNIPTFRI
jgi:hypothetical protein